MNVVLKIRKAIARPVSRKLLPESFTIISDDCWGGELYHQLRLQYTTPLVGLLVLPNGYLDFLNNICNHETPVLEFIKTEKKFPVARCLGGTIYFMHYRTEQEAREKFARRFKRINWNRLLVKIDFGKKGYTISDIERWNEMQIANSIAFYSPAIALPKSGIFNGILVSDWMPNGSVMFDITRKYFDVFRWVKTGKISRGAAYAILNFLLFDPHLSKRIANYQKRQTLQRNTHETYEN